MVFCVMLFFGAVAGVVIFWALLFFGAVVEVVVGF